MKHCITICLFAWFVCGCTGDKAGGNSDTNSDSSVDDTETASDAVGDTDSRATDEMDSDTDSDAATLTDENTDSGKEGDNGSVAKQYIGDVVFDQDELRSYYITISDSEYERFMDVSTLLQPDFSINKDRYVEVGLKVDDVELPSVGMRFKGDWSLKSCLYRGERETRIDPIFGNIDVCQRFSLKLDFNRYNEDSRLDGLKKLNLHAMAADPTKMHERLGYALFREMDILTPRAVHAKVFINGEYHGLFAAVEQVDGRFTANRFPEKGDGNLYKEVWPGIDVTETIILDALKTNDEADIADISDFVAFNNAVATAEAADFADTMTPFVDFDYLARYVVVDRAIHNFDGIMALYAEFASKNHNYYWYHEEDSNRFTLIPWDMDKVFMVPEPLFYNESSTSSELSELIVPCSPTNVPNWNEVSNTCDSIICTFDSQGLFSYPVIPPDCDPFLRLLRDEIYERQADIANEFIEGPFSEDRINEKLDRWEQQISEALEADAKVDGAAVREAISSLKDNIAVFQSDLLFVMSELIEERI